MLVERDATLAEEEEHLVIIGVGVRVRVRVRVGLVAGLAESLLWLKSSLAKYQ